MIDHDMSDAMSIMLQQVAGETASLSFRFLRHLLTRRKLPKHWVSLSDVVTSRGSLLVASTLITVTSVGLVTSTLRSPSVAKKRWGGCNGHPSTLQTLR